MELSHMCDMIKGNELDVGNTDLSFKLKEVTNSYAVHCLARNFKELFLSLQPEANHMSN